MLVSFCTIPTYILLGLLLSAREPSDRSVQSRGYRLSLCQNFKHVLWAMLVLIYAHHAHLMVPQKFERKKIDSFPTKYRPDNRSQIAVCDLVISVCDLTILYQMPEGPQETFFGSTSIPCV